MTYVLNSSLMLIVFRQHNIMQKILFQQVILPILLIFIATSHMNDDPGSRETRSLPLDLDIYADMPEKRVLYNIKLNDSNPTLRLVLFQVGLLVSKYSSTFIQRHLFLN